MNYFKPNTRTAMRLAVAVKGLTASMATMAYISSNAHVLFAIMLSGAVANEAINFLSHDTKEKNTDSSDAQK